jgi:hypothetical protein
MTRTRRAKSNTISMSWQTMITVTPFRVQLTHQTHDVHTFPVIQPGRWLVENQDFRLDRDQGSERARWRSSPAQRKGVLVSVNPNSRRMRSHPRGVALRVFPHKLKANRISRRTVF